MPRRILARWLLACWFVLVSGAWVASYTYTIGGGTGGFHTFYCIFYRGTLFLGRDDIRPEEQVLAEHGGMGWNKIDPRYLRYPSLYDDGVLFCGFRACDHQANWNMRFRFIGIPMWFITLASGAALLYTLRRGSRDKSGPGFPVT